MDFGPRYQTLQLLGAGSFGQVWKCFDIEDQCCVAIKHITGLFSGPPREATASALRQLREVKLLRLLSGSADIVKLKSILLPTRRDFQDLALVFELFEADLDQVIKLNHDLQPAHHQWFMFRMCKCLHHLHQSNILHRDLKPKNVLVNSDCKLAVCDFGLARAASQDESSEMWTDYVATRWYRAPELCGSFKATYTKAVDVWSMGCIFAEVLRRRPLFPGKDVVMQLEMITNVLGTPSLKTLAKVHNQKARNFLANMRPHPGIGLENKLPDADPLAVDLLKRMLAFDPDERITAAEALNHPYFDSLGSMLNQPEPVSTEQEFAYEQAGMDIDDIRELLYLEILTYHPQQQKEHEEWSLRASFASMHDLRQLQMTNASMRLGGSTEPAEMETSMDRSLTFTSDPGLPFERLGSDPGTLELPAGTTESGCSSEEI